MTRGETSLFVLMMFVAALYFGATRIDSETLTTVVVILFPLVFLAHIAVADTSGSVFGPVWLRRAQWAAIGGILLVAILMVRVF